MARVSNRSKASKIQLHGLPNHDVQDLVRDKALYSFADMWKTIAMFMLGAPAVIGGTP